MSEEPIEPQRESPAPPATPGERPVYSGGGALTPHEPRSWKPLLYASIAVVVVVAAILLGAHHAQQAMQGKLTQPSAYAAQMPVSGIKMSETSNMAGSKLTYIDAHVANTGQQTVYGASVQITFRDFTNNVAFRQVLPLVLIRSREPYVDTEQVSADPIHPGQSREFRMTFETVPDAWNGNYPEIKILGVDTTK